MKFTLTVLESQNFTATDLMLKFAKNDFSNGRYIVTYDRYGTTVLHDQKTHKEYVFNYWKLDKCTADGYITVTVYLTEKKNPEDLPDFNSPEAFFCEPD